MMIKFSWKKLNNKFSWNPPKVLEYLYTKRGITPKFYLGTEHKSVKIEAMKAFPSGNCYLINLDEALKCATSPNDLYYYLELASKRSLFDYRMRGVTYLSLHFVDEYLIGILEMNPMLEVKDDKIYFKHEQR